MTCPRVPASVAEPFLNDPEDLDLLVRRQPHLGIDLELDVERTVSGEDVHVSTKSRVERRRAACRGESEHREPRFLLRRSRGTLETWKDLLEWCAGLEHAHLGRDGEQVLRETVVDLACDAPSLVCDRSSELRLGNRSPHADEQDAVGHEAEEVSDEHVVARDDRA